RSIELLQLLRRDSRLLPKGPRPLSPGDAGGGPARRADVSDRCAPRGAQCGAPGKARARGETMKADGRTGGQADGSGGAILVPAVDVQRLLDAGAARDPSGVPGLATFTATMLQQGAGARSALDVADEAAFLGAQLGTTASFDGASASIHVPKRRLEAGLDLLADVVLRPSFADSEIARQRELRAAQLVQQRDEPVAVAN